MNYMSPFGGDTHKNLFTAGAHMRWGHNLLLFLVSLKSSLWQWQGFQQDDHHNDSIFITRHHTDADIDIANLSVRLSVTFIRWKHIVIVF